MVPPLSNGFLIAAASRFAMPSNNCVIGARTACCSALSTEGISRSSPEPVDVRAVAAGNEEIRKTAKAVAAIMEKNESSERKMIFMGTDSNLPYPRFQSFEVGRSEIRKTDRLSLFSPGFGEEKAGSSLRSE